MRRKGDLLKLIPLIILCVGIIGILQLGNWLGKSSDDENGSETETVVAESENTQEALQALSENNIAVTENATSEAQFVDAVDPSANTGIDMYVANCEEWITLRVEPSTWASEIAKIPLGTKIKYLKKDKDGFALVRYNDLQGYVLEEYLSLNPQKTVEHFEEKDTLYVVNCNESISLRKSESTQSTAITQIPLGASVQFLGNAKNGFTKISYNGKEGYALSQYLSYSKPVYQPQVNYGATVYHEEPIWLYASECKEFVTLREKPDTSSKEISKVILGDSVEFIDHAKNGFYKVSYQGDTGYVLGEYFTEQPPYVIYYRVAYCNEYITLRKTASTKAEALDKVYLNSIVTYLSDADNGFIKVGFNGKVGYVLKEYLARRN